jgi:hypothetical protein
MVIFTQRYTPSGLEQETGKYDIRQTEDPFLLEEMLR